MRSMIDRIRAPMDQTKGTPTETAEDGGQGYCTKGCATIPESQDERQALHSWCFIYQTFDIEDKATEERGNGEWGQFDKTREVRGCANLGKEQEVGRGDGSDKE